MNRLIIFILIGTVALSACTTDNGSDTVNSTQPGATGQAGSMARFTIINDNLYVLSGNSIITYNLTQSSNPQQLDSIGVKIISGRVETIFPKDTLLFLGASDGMYIYSVNNTKPQYVSRYMHIMACDPVVADHKYAYVTLRTGTVCPRSINQLHVIDITNIYNPTVVKTFSMSNPKGLGLQNGSLFVCDKKLKVFSVQSNNDELNMSLFKEFSVYDAHDIIPVSNTNRLIITAQDGIYQYTYQDGEIALLSRIPVL